MKKPEDTTELKLALKRDVEAGNVTIGEATKRMRKMLGLTQTEYAEKVLRIAPRVLMEIERGRGNPTIKTLNKIGKPFGYEIGFVIKA